MQLQKEIKITMWRLVGLIVFIVAGLLPNAMAHEIVLNSGESFISNQVWEENDKIRFNMHGLVVSVKKSDVHTVVMDQGTTLPIDPAKVSSSRPQFDIDKTDRAQSKPSKAKAVDDGTLTPDPGLTKPSSSPPSPKTKSIKGTGLNGLAWAATTASMPGLVKIKTDPEYGGVDQYNRPEDRLQIGNVRLDGMVYGFWRDQLFTIMLWVEGKPGYMKLKDVVRSHYGVGQQSTSGIERYVWKDADTDRMLEFDQQLNTGIFWMRSRRLDRQIKHLYPE